MHNVDSSMHVGYSNFYSSSVLIHFFPSLTSFTIHCYGQPGLPSSCLVGYIENTAIYLLFKIRSKLRQFVRYRKQHILGPFKDIQELLQTCVLAQLLHCQVWRSIGYSPTCFQVPFRKFQYMGCILQE